MKAIHLSAYGNPAQNLSMVEVSEPNTPSASEALVRMEYAPIDYSDLLLANGVYFLNPKLPSVIGGEGAGIVEAIGPGVTSVKVGDRVTIPFRTFTWSEKVLAPARGLFVVPPSVDAKTASMLNINPTTAVLLLDEFVKLKPKDWVVLNAVNSQVARCLIAIAKSRDLNVIGIVRRSELIPEIEKLGVDFAGVESPELSKQITPEIEAAACSRFKIPPAAWEEAKRRFPRLLFKVNQKRLRRIEYALKTGMLPPAGWTPPDPNNRSTQNVPPYASFWKH
jgi:NADPH:quinone reductase-like Zn-dependent oxidoreductase